MCHVAEYPHLPGIEVPQSWGVCTGPCPWVCCSHPPGCPCHPRRAQGSSLVLPETLGKSASSALAESREVRILISQGEFIVHFGTKSRIKPRVSPHSLSTAACVSGGLSPPRPHLPRQRVRGLVHACRGHRPGLSALSKDMVQSAGRPSHSLSGKKTLRLHVQSPFFPQRENVPHGRPSHSSPRTLAFRACLSASGL